MLNIILFGGGRWPRVIVHVLNDILEQNCHITWVSTYNTNTLEKWTKDKKYTNVTISKDNESLWDNKIDACIIATAPHTHAQYAKKTIKRGIPTFVEKPFTTNYADAEKLYNLSQQKKCPVGVDLVFMFASYLHEFSASLQEEEIKTVDIIWSDPALEIRHDEEKIPDFYTSIPNDMFPHAWSLLKIILPTLDFKLNNVDYDDKRTVIVQGVNQTTLINIKFSRHSCERVRKISINEGSHILDFTKEPGFSEHNNIKCEYKWRDKTPLYLSLQSFLDIVTDKIDQSQWDISLPNILSSMIATQDVDKALKELQKNKLEKILSENTLENHIDLLIDLFLPQMAEAGKRMPIKNNEDKKLFMHEVQKLFLN